MDLGGTSVSGPRPYNEDTFTHRDLSAHEKHLGGLKAFIMVSDGMGGHQSGDVASRIARETAEAYVDDLLRMAAENQLSVEPAMALQEIVAEANNAVLNAAAEAGGASMGATFVGAFVSDTRAWIGHVGDSRAYLLHRGVGTQLTIDHSQVGRLIAEGVLTEEQAQAHPQRNVIDRALGFSGAEAEVDLADLELGDAIVLCSDGLSTVLSGEEIAAVCGLSGSAQAASANLTEEALKAETDDNATAVVYAEDWSLFLSASPKAKETRRAMTAQRRAASRHNNAQRSTLYIGAALGIVALGLTGFMVMSTPKGGGTAKPVAKVRQDGSSAATTGPATDTNAARLPTVNATITADTKLREGRSTNKTVLAEIKDAQRVYIDPSRKQSSAGRDGKLWSWYVIDRTWLMAKWPQGPSTLNPKEDYEDWPAWPEEVWVREDRVNWK